MYIDMFFDNFHPIIIGIHCFINFNTSSVLSKGAHSPFSEAVWIWIITCELASQKSQGAKKIIPPPKL